jgi:hypothetical protein
MTQEPHSDCPPCFGDLDKVFPVGTEGLRESPPACLRCGCKTECLREALASRNGMKVQSELIDRAAGAGMLSFLSRWSHKKRLHQKFKKGS